MSKRRGPKKKSAHFPPAIDRLRRAAAYWNRLNRRREEEDARGEDEDPDEDEVL